MDLGLGGAPPPSSAGDRRAWAAPRPSASRPRARTVAVLARTPAALDDTVDAMRAAGSPDAVGIATDLTSGGRRRRGVRRGRRALGRRSTCSSTRPVRSTSASRAFEDLDDDEWIATFDIGTMSAVRCVRAALPLLRAAGVGPHRQRVGALDQAPVARARRVHRGEGGAHEPVSKNLSLSLAPEGILVNTVSPGSFLSEGMRDYLARAAARAQRRPRRASPTSCASSTRTSATRPTCHGPAIPDGDRPGDRVRRLAGQQLHDRRQRQRRRRQRLLLGAQREM